MHNVFGTLDEIENNFLSNLHNVYMLVDNMLIELDNLIENSNDEINLGLLNALKKLH